MNFGKNEGNKREHHTWSGNRFGQWYRKQSKEYAKQAHYQQNGKMTRWYTDAVQHRTTHFDIEAGMYYYSNWLKNNESSCTAEWQLTSLNDKKKNTSTTATDRSEEGMRPDRHFKCEIIISIAIKAV